MKNLIRILAVLIVCLVCMGQFMLIDDRYLNDFSKEFGETINVIYKRDQDKMGAKEFMQLAKKYNISFIQIKPLPKKNEKEPTPYHIYVYLHEYSWFKNQFPMLYSHENVQGENKFKSSDGTKFLTRKKIELLPFEQMPTKYLTGDYQFHGTKANIERFTQALESKSNMFEIASDPSFHVASHLPVAYINITYMLMFIFIIALLFCLYIYNGTLTKELSIAMLLGDNNIHFALEKSLRLFVGPALFSIIIIYYVIGHLVHSMTTLDFLRSMYPIFKYYIFTMGLCFLIQFVLLYLKTFKINIAEQIKGAHKTYEKVIVLIKILILSMVSYLLVITVIGITDYLKVKPHMNIWEKTKNYADISFSVPWTFIKQAEKDDTFVAPKVGKLWDLLDEKGSILFKPEYREKENMFYDQEYANTLPFKGKYAYINKNYLNEIPVIDTKGNRIKIDQINRSEWIILVPEHIDVTDRDKMGMRGTHKHEHKGEKSRLQERYISIKSNQQLFSFDSQGKIDQPATKDYALVLVNGKELSDLGSIKVPSLINGNYHSYVRNPSYPLKELAPFIKESGVESYVIYTSTVFDEVREKIEVYKTTALVNFIAMLLSFLILGTLYKIDRETYYYHEGQRIDVSQLMGYRFLDIHRKKIFLNVGIYILAFLGFFILSVGSIFLKSDGVFVPRDGWTNEWILFSFIFISVVLIISFIIDALLLRRNDKQITIRLKEGQ